MTPRGPPSALIMPPKKSAPSKVATRESAVAGRAPSRSAVGAPGPAAGGPSTRQFAQATIDALSAHLCVLDASGTILAVNRAWRKFAATNPPLGKNVAAGANYLAVCDSARGPDAPIAAAFAHGIRQVLRGRQAIFSLEYPCHSPSEQRWFVGRVSRFAGRGPARVVVAHENVTERRKAQEALLASREQLRALTGRLQAAREEERMSVAREIHDVLAQDLTRLKIDLVWLQRRLAQRRPGPPATVLADRVTEMCRMADTAILTVQRIATGLRPVVLDSLGLSAAIEWQGRDFEAHAGIKCRISVPEEEPPLTRIAATAAFRILQESLTNVLRHARATRVEVSLQEVDAWCVLRIADNGRGIQRTALRNPRSLGLVGMRERAELLGGKLTIRTLPRGGTLIEVRLPLAESEPSSRPS